MTLLIQKRAALIPSKKPFPKFGASRFTKMLLFFAKYQQLLRCLGALECFVIKISYKELHLFAGTSYSLRLFLTLSLRMDPVTSSSLRCLLNLGGMLLSDCSSRSGSLCRTGGENTKSPVTFCSTVRRHYTDDPQHDGPQSLPTTE